MKNLLHPDTICTDPDNLQFCLMLSDTNFWYCEPNWYHNKLFTTSFDEALLIEKYKGNPVQFLKDAQTVEVVKTLVANPLLWLHNEVDVDEMSISERIEQLNDYGYTWDSFTNEAERNMIIAENYFEQHPNDFRHDI